MGTARIELHFSSWSEPELVRTSFVHPLLSYSSVQAARGSVSPRGSRIGSFKWSAGVQALSALLIRHASSSPSDPRAPYGRIIGANGSPASALDYALSKKPAWLADIFGADSKGDLLATRLLRRINSERRRPGPVTVFVNESIIEAQDVAILVNAERLTERSLLAELAARIEGHKACDESASQFVFIDTDSEAAEPERRSSLPIDDEYISTELAGYVQLVSQNIFNPYISIGTPEVWSTADAFLALVRIPEAQEQLRTRVPRILDLLRPPSSSGYTVEESDLPIPLVTATCVMALAELRESVILPDSLNPEVDEYLGIAITQLLDSQAQSGWWSIIGAPRSILEHDENARAWDTGYILLALEHLRRLGLTSERVEKAQARALAWLLDVYDPALGWTNAPSFPFRRSTALNTFGHFVVMYTSYGMPKDSLWKPSQARGHLESLSSPVEWMEELDKHEYRLKGAQGLSLPHPHHINHLAFLLALTKSVEESGPENVSPLNLDIPWAQMFTQLGRSKAVYLFSQVLQGLHLFTSEK